MFLNDLLDMVNRKKRDEERSKNARRFAVGMGIAALIGLGKGILYAPKSGEETREALKKKAAETVGALKEKIRTKAKMLKGTTLRAAKEVQETIAPKSAAGRKKS